MANEIVKVVENFGEQVGLTAAQVKEIENLEKSLAGSGKDEAFIAARVKQLIGRFAQVRREEKAAVYQAANGAEIAAAKAAKAAAKIARAEKKLGIEGWENGQPGEGEVKLVKPTWASAKAFGFDVEAEHCQTGLEARVRVFLPKAVVKNGCAALWLVRKAEAAAAAQFAHGSEIDFTIRA